MLWKMEHGVLAVRMKIQDTAGNVESGESLGSGYEGSTRQNDGDFSNKKAGIIKQVIRKRNVILFIFNHILFELNGLYQREFTY